MRCEVGFLALQLQVQRRPPVEPRGVGEQVGDGHLVLAAAAERGQERGDRLVEVQPALVHQDHRHGRGDDDLRQAGQVVERVRPHGRATRARRRGARRRAGGRAPRPCRPPPPPPGRRAPGHGSLDARGPPPPSRRVGSPPPRGGALRSVIVAPGQAEPMAIRVQSGQRDRQPALDEVLAEDRAHGRALAGLRPSVGRTRRPARPGTGAAGRGCRRRRRSPAGPPRAGAPGAARGRPPCRSSLGRRPRARSRTPARA